MPRYDLSVIIPARNEMFLQNTVDDLTNQKRGNTQIIVIADGGWPLPPGLKKHPDVVLYHRETSIGQRAAINHGARISNAKYIMKLDAHCRMDEGFDVKLMADCEYKDIIVPRLYNLHAFDWKCTNCGHQTYQGPKLTKCTKCEQTAEHEMLMVWEPRWSRVTNSMRFDSDLHFQYWRDFNKSREEGKGDFTPTMGLLGACWFLHRDFYWDIDGSDEAHGSWGQQGTEIACKAWLSGGRLMCNQKTWYSHLFRTQPGFGFPYPLTHGQTERARAYSKSFWREGRWDKAVHPLSWLVEKFWPVPGWTADALEELKATEKGRKVQFAIAMESEKNRQHVQSASDNGLTKGIVYYTENQCREPIFSKVQQNLKNAINGHLLVSVSLKPIDFGENFVLGLERSYVTMFQQILMGLSQLDTDIAYLCEHDVLYAPDHFSFTPPAKDVYYYNENVWYVSARSGRSLFHYHRSVSQLCGYRTFLLDHYRERLARIEKEGFSYRNGFEPGTRRISHGGYDNYTAQSWFAQRPNVDIRDHGTNLTRTLWKKENYRNPKYTAGWEESDHVPGWGVTLNRFDEWLKEAVK